MKKYHFKYGLSLSLAFLMAACEGIFIMDPIEPRLPKYTETGNNVAGAFVNGETWKSLVSWGWSISDNAPRFYSFPNDSLVIIFDGKYGVDEDFLLQFSIAGFGIQNANDLQKLNGLKIPLNGVLNRGMINAVENVVEQPCQHGVGQLYTKSVKLQESGFIYFSGTFGFTIEGQNCEIIKVEYGRFDYRVNDYNFMN